MKYEEKGKGKTNMNNTIISRVGDQGRFVMQEMVLIQDSYELKDITEEFLFTDEPRY